MHGGLAHRTWIVAVPIAEDAHVPPPNARTTLGSILSSVPLFFFSVSASRVDPHLPHCPSGGAKRGEGDGSERRAQTKSHALTPRITSLASGWMRATEKKKRERSVHSETVFFFVANSTPLFHEAMWHRRKANRTSPRDTTPHRVTPVYASTISLGTKIREKKNNNKK